MRTKDYKAELEKISEGYQDARDEEFHKQFIQEFLHSINTGYVLTEDDIRGFLESFTFPEEFEWAASEYESQIDAYEDAKHEEAKDEKMGLND